MGKYDSVVILPFATSLILASHIMRAIQRQIFFILLLPTALAAQTQRVYVRLPDLNLQADQLLRGDGDTYGLGNWTARFVLRREDDFLLLDGKLIFTEDAHDHTTIVGTVHKRYRLSALQNCRNCTVRLMQDVGVAEGPNIGARGYRWFEGRGLLKKAYLRTDVFGADTGHIGGRFVFRRLGLEIACPVAIRSPDFPVRANARRVR